MSLCLAYHAMNVDNGATVSLLGRSEGVASSGAHLYVHVVAARLVVRLYICDLSGGIGRCKCFAAVHDLFIMLDVA